MGHFRHSYNKQNAHEEQLQLKQHKIIQEVSTRWNSTLEMYKRLLEQQAAVSAVLLALESLLANMKSIVQE